MPVRMLVDAFQYTEWGVVTGSVRAVSSDVVQMDGRPMFKVTCSLAQRRLSLRTGVEGELKKGMTLQAHFVVATRSLAQLLSDNVSDWLDPSRASAADTGSAS
jgi:HlyD family secretion protein